MGGGAEVRRIPVFSPGSIEDSFSCSFCFGFATVAINLVQLPLRALNSVGPETYTSLRRAFNHRHNKRLLAKVGPAK